MAWARAAFLDPPWLARLDDGQAGELCFELTDLARLYRHRARTEELQAAFESQNPEVELGSPAAEVLAELLRGQRASRGAVQDGRLRLSADLGGFPIALALPLTTATEAEFVEHVSGLFLSTVAAMSRREASLARSLAAASGPDIPFDYTKWSLEDLASLAHTYDPSTLGVDHLAAEVMASLSTFGRHATPVMSKEPEIADPNPESPRRKSPSISPTPPLEEEEEIARPTAIPSPSRVRKPQKKKLRL